MMKLKDLKNINRIIVHGNCPDGMSSAILLYDALKIEPEFHLHNLKSFQNLKITPNTLFCDICPPEHLVDKFVAAGGIVLDHHKGVESSVKKFGSRGVFADEKKEPGISGAYLAYREVYVPKTKNRTNDPFTNNAEHFARLAGIRDTWQKDNKDWEVACHQAAGLTFYPWKYWKNEVDRSGRDGDRYFAFRDEMAVGKMIFENRLNKAKVCADEAFITKRHGLRVAVFNDHDRLTSDVAEILRQDGVNIIAGFFYTKESQDSLRPILCYSLRSDGSFDVSKLARMFGGNGHTKAAGYRKTICMKDDPFSIFLNDLDEL